MLQFIKAIAAAVASLVAVVIAAIADQNISFDEVNLIWLAVIPILTALGVAVAPKNRQ